MTQLLPYQPLWSAETLRTWHQSLLGSHSSLFSVWCSAVLRTRPSLQGPAFPFPACSMSPMQKTLARFSSDQVCRSLVTTAFSLMMTVLSTSLTHPQVSRHRLQNACQVLRVSALMMLAFPATLAFVVRGLLSLWFIVHLNLWGPSSSPHNVVPSC